MVILLFEEEGWLCTDTISSLCSQRDFSLQMKLSLFIIINSPWIDAVEWILCPRLHIGRSVQTLPLELERFLQDVALSIVLTQWGTLLFSIFSLSSITLGLKPLMWSYHPSPITSKLSSFPYMTKFRLCAPLLLPCYTRTICSNK